MLKGMKATKTPGDQMSVGPKVTLCYKSHFEESPANQI